MRWGLATRQRESKPRASRLTRARLPPPPVFPEAGAGGGDPDEELLELDEELLDEELLPELEEELELLEDEELLEGAEDSGTEPAATMAPACVFIKRAPSV